MQNNKDHIPLFFDGKLKLSSLSVATVGAASISLIFVAIMIYMILSPSFGWVNKLSDNVILEDSTDYRSPTLVSFIITEKPYASIKTKHSKENPEDILIFEKPLADQALIDQVLKNKSIQKEDQSSNQYSSLLEKSSGDRVPPVYPRRALDRNIEGYVLVEFTVDKKGRVQNIVIIESVPESVFEKSVIRALQLFKYNPIIVEGEAIPIDGIQRRFEFKLQV